MRGRRVMTEEMFESIPMLVGQGIGTEEIAERFGVKATSLKVMCSNPQHLAATRRLSQKAG